MNLGAKVRKKIEIQELSANILIILYIAAILH